MSDRAEPVRKGKLAVNSTKTEGGQVAHQFQDKRPEASSLMQLQAMANRSAKVQHTAQLQATANKSDKLSVVQAKKNNTGLPDNLKSGIENLSGMAMDDVKVHRNSDKPAQLNAHAYAQGTDIHLASGQEKHLPHEAWHVVQQKQGRVKPTMQMKGNPLTELRAGVNVNDDTGLEKEADVMGAKAINKGAAAIQFKNTSPINHSNASHDKATVQKKVMSGRLNVIGEKHSDYKKGRDNEKEMLKDWYNISGNKYWQEHEFKGVETTKEGKPKAADPIIEHCRVQLLGLISAIKDETEVATLLKDGVNEKVIKGIESYWKSTYKSFLYLFHPDIEEAGKKHQEENYAVDASHQKRLTSAHKLFEKADKAITKLRSLKTDEGGKWYDWTKALNKKSQRNHVAVVRQLLHQVDQILGNVLYNVDEAEKQDESVNVSREVAMVGAANQAVDNGFTGAWKIGTSHIKSMLKVKGPHAGTKGAKFTITDRGEFLAEMKQYDKGKEGIVSLIPGEEVRDIPVPDPSERTGVKEEINITN